VIAPALALAGVMAAVVLVVAGIYHMVRGER
jgi:hypothetical protein